VSEGRGAGPAGAADFCIKHYRPGFGAFFSMVGKGFKVPSKGRCKPFLGFATSTQSLDIFDVTGSACTATNGSNVQFVLTEIHRFGSVSFVSMTLPLPLGPSGTMTRRFMNNSSETTGPSPESCPIATMPVP
jgi:hypothetical protein